MSIWGTRLAPEFMSASAKSWLTPGIGETRKAERDQTQAVTEAALRGLVATNDLDIEWPAPDRTPPFWRARQHRRHLHRTSVRYGKEPSQLLDVWRRKDLPVRPAPVLIFVPGGAWVHGGRQLQGYALMSHLAEMGWVCLSAEYRVSPHHRWPSHITDVKTAIAWARANVDKFGGDRDFIAVAGCLAGGHLASLAGLTNNDPDMQTELPPDLGYLRRCCGRHLRPLRLGGPLYPRAATVRRVPRAGGGQTQNKSASRGVPQCLADCSDTRRRPTVFGDSRQQRQGDPSRAGAQLRRGTAGCLPFAGRLCGVARRRTRFRHDRWRADRAMSTAVGLFLNQVYRNRMIAAKEVI